MLAKDVTIAYRIIFSPFTAERVLELSPIIDSLPGKNLAKELRILCPICHVHVVPLNWQDSAANFTYFKNNLVAGHIITTTNPWNNQIR